MAKPEGLTGTLKEGGEILAIGVEPLNEIIEEPVSEMLLAEGVPTPVSKTPSIDNTQAFFGAISYPIDGKNPPKPFGYKKTGWQTFEEWVRNWEILGMHIGTDAILQETGGKHGISRERVRQIVNDLADRA